MGICGILYLYIIFIILIPACRSANSRHAKVGKFYIGITLYAIVVWAIFAVVWGLADENRLFNVDTEIVLFAVVNLFYGIIIIAV